MSSRRNGVAGLRVVRRLALALVAIVIAHGPAPADDASDRRTIPRAAPRVALVIGNANYTRLTKLKNPLNDARLMADRLTQLGFEVVSVSDRTLPQLTQDVETFARTIRQLGRDTVSVVFYAGHGLESESINYLVPVNADIKRRAEIRTEALSVKQVADLLSGAANQLNILVIDACRDNPFPETALAPSTLGLVPMGAVYGVFIASSTGSGKAAFDGNGDNSLYTGLLAEALLTPGQKLEDIFKSVRRQVRLGSSEQQIPWESTSLEADFYFVPPAPPPSPAAQLLAAARESANAALYDLLIERFPDAPEAKEARAAVAGPGKVARAGAAEAPQASAETVLARARQIRTAEAFDLVASLFPATPQADEARQAAAKLREAFALDSAGPTYQGRELIERLREQLVRLQCAPPDAAAEFNASTVQALRRASLLSDDRFLWHRPTMAALRALQKVDAAEGCQVRKLAEAPACLRIGAEEFCR
jgi:uncharacterized caspase-like protein